MADDALGSADRKESPAANGRLDSWKEIAAYLKRDVTTVRRWEKREGLPVHRHLHERRDSVYAYAAEIDGWWQGRRSHLAENGAVDGVTLEGGNGSSVSAVLETPRRLPLAARAQLAWALAATFLAAALMLAGLLFVRSRPDGRPDAAELRFSIFPPEGTSFGSVSLSPDGRHLAFTAGPASTSGGKTLLWVRTLDTLAARSLPDTEDAAFAFWSPASDALGFFAGGRLWTVDIAGGSPRIVSDAPHGRGGTWNRDGIIVFAPGREGELFRVPASGGAATPVTTVAGPDERGHLWPEFLPDGNHFLYLADANSTRPEDHNLFVAALDGTEPQRLLSVASNAAYNSEGYLLFVRERQLIAQPFSASQLVVTGEPVTVADRVQQQSGFDHKADYSVSANGALVYRTMQSPATRLIWHDRTQPLSPLVSTPAEYTEPALSPDEGRVAVDLFDPRPSKRFGYGVVGVRSDIWILDRSGAASQFTSDPAADWGPVWSPDGRAIVFSSNRREGTLELYQKDATGAGGDELPLTSSGMNPVAQSWSPDGKFILYSAFDPKTRMDLWLLPMSGADRTPVALLRTKFNEMQGQISPHGRWLAYTSNESGRGEVYVQDFPNPAAKWQISTTGGGDPRWRPDGRELFYIAENRQLMAVPVKIGATFEHGPPVSLFDTGVPPHWYEARNLYDVTRDGQFLFMTPVDDDRSSPLTVVVNWTARLRNRD